MGRAGCRARLGIVLGGRAARCPRRGRGRRSCGLFERIRATQAAGPFDGALEVAVGTLDVAVLMGGAATPYLSGSRRIRGGRPNA